MCLSFTFEQFLLHHNLSRWKIISKQTKSNKLFLRNRKLHKRNSPISMATFTSLVGLQDLRNNSRYSTHQIPLLVRSSFCIKSGSNVPRSRVLRLGHPTAMGSQAQRCAPASILFRSLWGGKEFWFGLVSRWCCSTQLGENHWTYAPRQKPDKKFSSKLEMDPSREGLALQPALFYFAHYTFYKACYNLNHCIPRCWGGIEHSTCR